MNSRGTLIQLCSCLKAWFKSRDDLKDIDSVRLVLRALLLIFKDYSHCDRVTVPALKAACIAIDQPVVLRADDSESSLVELVQQTQEELKGTKNVNKLLQGTLFYTKAVVTSASLNGKAGTLALRHAILLLGHRYPKVRKAAYDQLYLTFLAVGADCVYLKKISSKSCPEQAELPKPENDCSTEMPAQEVLYEAVLDILLSTAWNELTTLDARGKLF